MKNKMETLVKNKNGSKFPFGHAVILMDNEIMEMLHNKIAPCTEQEFFDAYCKEHEKKYGKEFVLEKANPCY